MSLRKELDLELAFAWLDLGQLKKRSILLSHASHVYVQFVIAKRLPAKEVQQNELRKPLLDEA